MNFPVLQLLNLSLILSGSKHGILHDINYSVFSGDFIILLGHNGSGKSSLLKILDRRYTPTSGEIRFNGKNIALYRQTTLARNIVTITQNCQESLFPNLSVLDNCIIAKQFYERNLTAMGTDQDRYFFLQYLGSFNERLPKKMELAATTLSGGEQQLLTLALNMLFPPKILLLDEHTSALDPKTAAKVMDVTLQYVAKHGITCIMSTHNLEWALTYGNKILVLKQGEIATSIEAERKKRISAKEILKYCY